jgi:hypothetical protein
MLEFFVLKAKIFMHIKKKKCVILTIFFENVNVLVKCVDYHKLNKLVNI